MSLDKTKTDADLGLAVHNHLLKLGLETPITDRLYSSDMDKIAEIKPKMQEIMEILGLDLSNDSLEGTPARVAKMMVNEQYWGLKSENFPKCATVNQTFNYDSMVKCDTIQVMSQCEHHLIIIDGFATIAYIPAEKVLGISKINRIVEYFSRRPQIQERLTCQIFETMSFILGHDDIAVTINAKHYCVASRGVGDSGSRTTTSKLGGSFKTMAETRAEFFVHFKSHLGNS